LIQHYRDTKYRRCIRSTKIVCTLDALDAHVQATAPSITKHSSVTVLAQNVKG
jgi:hypothetical protein